MTMALSTKPQEHKVGRATWNNAPFVEDIVGARDYLSKPPLTFPS